MQEVVKESIRKLLEDRETRELLGSFLNPILLDDALNTAPMEVLLNVKEYLENRMEINRLQKCQEKCIRVIGNDPNLKACGL